MKYYVIEITDGDSKVKGKGVYEFDDKQSAEASYHKKIGIALDSPLYKEHLIMVADSDGAILYVAKHVSNKWVEPQVASADEEESITEE